MGVAAVVKGGRDGGFKLSNATSLHLIRQKRRFVRDLEEFVVRFWLACSMVAFCWLCRDGRDRGSGSCFGTCCKYVVRSGVTRLRDVGVRFGHR